MLRKTMSPEPRRSASPPRSRSPVNQLQSPTAGTDSLKENLGAHQPPTFPWKTRPLTAGPKSRVAPSRSPTYRRPASSLQQRPSARPFSDLQPAPRQKTEISDGDYFGDNIISPWESDLPQTTFRTSFFEKETLPEPHQNRPSTAHRSSPIDKASSGGFMAKPSFLSRGWLAISGCGSGSHVVVSKSTGAVLGIRTSERIPHHVSYSRLARLSVREGACPVELSYFNRS